MKTKITLPNIKGFLQGNFRKLLKELDYLPYYIRDQAQWRIEQVRIKSPECYDTDKCRMPCKCQVSAKVFEDRSCSGHEIGEPCYPEMMDESTWNQFVKDNKIRI